MANWTYNTEHGNFLLKEDKIGHAADALWSFIDKEGIQHEETEKSLECALGVVGFEYSMNDAGDIIDVFLANSYFGEMQEKALKTIAPFVTSGSFLVFVFGGVEACWAPSFVKNQATDIVEMHIENVEVVLDEDLRQMLLVLQKTVPTFYKVMLEKYAPQWMREELESKPKEPS